MQPLDLQPHDETPCLPDVAVPIGASLAAAIEALTDEDRQLLALHYQEGLSPAECARTLEAFDAYYAYRRLGELRAQLLEADPGFDDQVNAWLEARQAKQAARTRQRELAAPTPKTHSLIIADTLKDLALRVVTAATSRDRHRAEQRECAARAGIVFVPTEFPIRTKAAEGDAGTVVGHVFKTSDGREYARQGNGRIVCGATKVKGKAAVKAYKRERQRQRERSNKAIPTPALEWNGAADVLV